MLHLVHGFWVPCDSGNSVDCENASPKPRETNPYRTCDADVPQRAVGPENDVLFVAVTLGRSTSLHMVKS
jgi:hypothetical protein